MPRVKLVKASSGGAEGERYPIRMALRAWAPMPRGIRAAEPRSATKARRFIRSPRRFRSPHHFARHTPEELGFFQACGQRPSCPERWPAGRDLAGAELAQVSLAKREFGMGE